MSDKREMGGNAARLLRERAERMQRLLDDKAVIDDDIKSLKAEMNADGYGRDELKSFAQCIKELRRGPEFQADQLRLELVLDTYRQALGLPTDAEEADALAREEASAPTEPKSRSRRHRDLDDALSDPALDGTSVAVGDGPYHELGSVRRGKRERIQ